MSPVEQGLLVVYGVVAVGYTAWALTKAVAELKGAKEGPARD